jgi:peptidoglycan/LPS O-acetylase OafA/YrhL
MQRIEGLDLMRAAAISLVLLHHVIELVMPHASWAWQLWGTGPLGVDLFFALSGFLIGRILLRLGATVAEPPVLAGFWGRRWLRTLPLYYLILAVNLAAVIAREGQPGAVLKIAAPYFIFSQSLLTRGPLFFSESWSLAVEEWFYLLFPLLWAGLVRLRIKPLPGYVLGGFLLLLVPMALRLRLDPDAPRMWLYDVSSVTFYRLDSIAVGVLAAAISLRFPAAWQRWRYPGLGLGLAMLVLDWRLLTHVRDKPASFMLVGYFIASGVGCALLLPWCSLARGWRPSLFQRAVAAVARWSYALYLVHLLWLNGARSLFAAQLRSSAAWSWFVVALVLALSLVTAAALHRWVERPVMAWRDRRLKTPA